MNQNYFNDVLWNGTSYELAHLNPIFFEFFGEKVKKILKIKVLFSDHCFTERSDKTVANSERKFSQQRYELSKLLPNLILQMNSEKVQVYQTSARRNFAYVVRTTLNEQDYNIFFELRKRNDKNHDCDLLMRIESAYVFDDGKALEYSGRIRFLILCQKIYLGEKIQCRK